MSRTTMPLMMLTLIAAGCGGGLCKKSEKAADECGYDFDAEACEKDLEGCSGSDENKIDNFADCAGFYECAEEGDSTTGLGFFACFAELEGISPECAAFTFDTTFSFSSTSSTL